MNDNPDNSKSRPEIDPALEARIVALVLGEASAQEVAELDSLIAQDLRLQAFKRQIERVHDLAREAHGSGQPGVKMSEDRRQKLLEAIGAKSTTASENIVATQATNRRTMNSQLLLRVAASVMMAAVVGAFIHTAATFKNSPQSIAAILEEQIEESAGEVTLKSEAILTTGIVKPTSEPNFVTAIGKDQLAQINGFPDQEAARMNEAPKRRLVQAQTSGLAMSVNTADPRSLSTAPMEPSSATASIVNQPIFTTMDGKADFDGYINYGAPIVAGTESSEKTKQLLTEAERLKAQGSLELAAKRFQQVLTIDDNQIAARQGLEETESEREAAVEATFNNARSRMLWSVDKGWELPVRKFEIGDSTIIESPDASSSQAALIDRKLDEIIIPRIDFRDASLRDALDFLKTRAASLDKSEEDASKKGINIVLNVPPEAPARESEITVSVENIPLRAALEYVAQAAGLKVETRKQTVNLVPREKASEKIKPTPRPTPIRLPEIDTSKQSTSTFSLHVSNVSFQLARNTLAASQVPDPQSIRPEEFYNAFEYGDPSPTSEEKVACRIEQSAHPFRQQRNLVRIGVKVAASGRAANQPLRLTVLLDTSGSMEREDRVASVRRALEALTGLLGPQDRVTLIGFARSPRLLAEEVPGDQASELANLVARTPSEGGTNLEQALALASEMAFKQRLPEAQNRIVLLTDGAANLGNDDPARLAQQIEATRQKGISFDACGVGANGLNDKILEALTRKGDGRYYFLNAPEDADAGFARKLAGTLRPAAENVKVQVVFNPARVRHHRLIGFEEHVLKEEDFRDDAVQAAELAAEDEGIALYQVEPMPEGEGDIGQVFVRFRDPASQMMVERSWTIPYEERTPPFNRAAPSLQLAATAALLAEKLQGDNEVDVDALTPVLTALRQHFPHQAAVADLLQMCRQMKP